MKFLIILLLAIMCQSQVTSTNRQGGKLNRLARIEDQILRSRIGFANEKEFHRKENNDLKKYFSDFKSDIIEARAETKTHLKKLDSELSNLQETSKLNQRMIDTIMFDLNGNINETGVHGTEIDSMKEMLEDLNTKQNKLEMENLELKQTVSDLGGELVLVKARMPCEENWKRFNNHCYLFTSAKVRWRTALDRCRSKNSYLIEITSESELEFVAGLDIWIKGGIWTGASDEQEGYEGTYVFHESKQLVPQNLWNEGEPNNHKGKEHCVELLKDRPKLNDAPCGWGYSFICEKSISVL